MIGRHVVLMLVAMLFVCSCEKSGKGVDSVSHERQIEAFLLYKVASVSGADAPPLAQSYSRAVTECFLMGVIEHYPVNFINEHRDMAMLDMFDESDPLGWSDELKGGAKLTVEKDLGLLILESSPNEFGVRDIHDVVLFRDGLFSIDGAIDYTLLGGMVREGIERAKEEHRSLMDEVYQK